MDSEVENPSQRVRWALSWENDSFRNLIEELGSRQKILLIIGSGATADVGLPRWPDLVSRLLVATKGLTPESADEMVRIFGPIQAATFARTGIAERLDWNSAIRRELYGVRQASGSNNEFPRETHPTIEPGALLQSIAELAILYPKSTIFTTNFDDLLKRAVTQAGELARSAELQYWEPKVEHLHGFLPQSGSLNGWVALDEEGYSRIFSTVSDKLSQQLRDSAALFLGMGMTDADIVQALYKAKGFDRRARRQSAPPWYAIQFESSGGHGEDELRSHRLHHLGISQHKVNGPEQVAQVVAELRLYRRFRSRYPDNRFGPRIRHWQDELTKKFNALEAVSTRAELIDKGERRQWHLHKYLQTFVRQLPRRIGYRIDDSKVRWGLFLFVRGRTEDLGAYLELLATSNVFHADRSSNSAHFRNIIPRRRVINTAANAAFLGGVALQFDAPGSRWRTQVGVPIFLSGEPWERLMVGVLLFGSTARMEESKLGTLEGKLVSELERLGLSVLDPHQSIDAIVASSM